MEPKLTPARLIALLALTVLPARAAFGAEALIAVDVPAGGCPGRAEVTGALESRLPGVTRGRGGSGPSRYRLEVSHAAGEAEAPLRLKSLAGGVVLERRLPVEARARPAELCQALAEAAALVVVRYLRDLGYRPEPEPPPPDEPRPEAAGARPSTTAPAPAPATTPAAGSPPAATPPAGSPPERNGSAGAADTAGHGHRAGDRRCARSIGRAVFGLRRVPGRRGGRANGPAR